MERFLEWGVESHAETEFDMRRNLIVLLLLIVYIAIFFSLAVLFRESSDKCSIRLELFKDFLEPGPDGFRDLFQNVVGFIPVGVLVGLLPRRHRVAKAILAGVLLSLAIEVSQLAWKKGVFDVNDLFNNAVGAVIGGIIAVFICRTPKRIAKRRLSLRGVE